jgi:hypothetical protein
MSQPWPQPPAAFPKTEDVIAFQLLLKRSFMIKIQNGTIWNNDTCASVLYKNQHHGRSSSVVQRKAASGAALTKWTWWIILVLSWSRNGIRPESPDLIFNRTQTSARSQAAVASHTCIVGLPACHRNPTAREAWQCTGCSSGAQEFLWSDRQLLSILPPRSCEYRKPTILTAPNAVSNSTS